MMQGKSQFEWTVELIAQGAFAIFITGLVAWVLFQAVRETVRVVRQDPASVFRWSGWAAVSAVVLYVCYLVGSVLPR